LSSIRRFTVRTGSALVFLLLFLHAAARADIAKYSYHGRQIAFTHLSRAAGSLGIGIEDPGLRVLLQSIGAVLTWHPGERYVLITTAQPQVVSFSVGDTAYDVGPVTAQAGFAPYLVGEEVYVPLDELLRALYLAPHRDGAQTVLQPQLAAIDVQGSGSEAVLVAHGAGILQPRVANESADEIVYIFDGVGTTLARTRPVNVGGVTSLEIAQTGTIRDPQTIVTIHLAPGAHHGTPVTENGAFEVAFAAAGSVPPMLAAQVQTPQVAAEQTPAPAEPEPTASPEDAQASAQPQQTPSAAPSSAPGAAAIVSGVTVAQTSDGATVSIAVSGDATYGWHRLREPDNRFWIDISAATLQGPPIDQNETGPILSMRVKQNGDDMVRVALSLGGQNELSVSPSSTGITIEIGNAQTADALNEGSGSVGAVVSVNEPQALVTPVPQSAYGQPNEGTDTNWKFAPRGGYVPPNPRLIVIDPGHGGGDRGAIRGDTDEATLNLDMAERLRAVLVAHGWQVKLTRTTDHDVDATARSTAEAAKYGFPNDSDADDLQARDDIANSLGARLFVSIHCNSFINSGPSGTTTYFTKPIDLPLAQSVQSELVQSVGTKDDGIVKARYYVTVHARMPAILIETAFLSNPGDYALLTSTRWRQKVAESIASGIDRYANAYPVGADP
jgi:N-acetylmuramoyl-L-alanine amidase